MKSPILRKFFKTSNCIFLAFLLVFACNPEQKRKEKANQISAFSPSKTIVVLISELADSLQPKVFQSKGVRTNIENPEIKKLEVLKNSDGKTILNQEGKPFILGNGGKSNFTNFSTDHGLALDAIRCSMMDSDGNLWFGTQGGGVSRYDGKSFVNFSTDQGLINSIVYCMQEDRNGNLWFGTDSGVSRYDGKSFVSFTTEQGLANNYILDIIEDKDGNLWFATYGGLSRFDGNLFKNFTNEQGLASNNLLSLAEDKKGNIWIGTQGGGVSRFNGKSFKNFTTDQGLINNNVWCIFEDKNGKLWMGTDEGVSCFNGDFFKNYTAQQGLANPIVMSISDDSSGNLWFGTQGGVSSFDGKTFVSYTTTQGLASNHVISILVDKSGDLWFSTYDNGMSRFDGKSFTNFTTAQGLANNIVFSVTEDKQGNHWFGTQSGLSLFDGQSFTNFEISQNKDNNIVFGSLEDKNGNIWFGTNGGGVGRFDGKTLTTYTSEQGLVNDFVFSMAEDKTGKLWFGTISGISVFDGKSFTNYTAKQGLVDGTISAITEDSRGNIWIGSYSSGVSLFDGKSFTNFTTAQGLANDLVYSIIEDDNGNLWFGTDKGLSLMGGDELKIIENQIKNSKGEIQIQENLFKNFSTEDGLPNNSITQLSLLPNHTLVAGTNLGIALFQLSKDKEKLENIEIFNSNTGFPIKDVNAVQNSIYTDSRGIIWIGTGSAKTGLVRFDYSELKKYKLPPVVKIQSIKVDDENISWFDLNTKGIRNNQKDSATAMLQEFLAYGKNISETKRKSVLKQFKNIRFDSITKFYALPTQLVLPYQHNQISFEFAAIETSRPQMVQYRYILEAYDKGWSSVTHQSNATFGNMNEGNYTFKVKALGSNGIWSEPVSYSFEVLPPWYRTWWAYLAYVLLTLIVLRLYFLWRVRKLRAEKKLLKKKVAEKTKELSTEKKKSDDLLLNILPDEIAEELKEKGKAEARQYNDVSVLFTDFVNFTQTSAQLTPQQIVKELNECFTAFDQIIEKNGLERIKTIGDAYMAVCGLPTPNPEHGLRTVQAAIEIISFIEERRKRENAFNIRIGINSGSVVAGIVGIKKFAYDIWGDTVNTAARMEQNGIAGKVNISEDTYKLIKNNPKFEFESRGAIPAKGKGEVAMYFVEEKV